MFAGRPEYAPDANPQLLKDRDQFLWVSHTWHHIDCLCIESNCDSDGMWSFPLPPQPLSRPRSSFSPLRTLPRSLSLAFQILKRLYSHRLERIEERGAKRAQQGEAYSLTKGKNNHSTTFPMFNHRFLLPSARRNNAGDTSKLPWLYMFSVQAR